MFEKANGTGFPKHGKDLSTTKAAATGKKSWHESRNDDNCGTLHLNGWIKGKLELWQTLVVDRAFYNAAIISLNKITFLKNYFLKFLVFIFHKENILDAVHSLEKAGQFFFSSFLSKYRSLVHSLSICDATFIRVHLFSTILLELSAALIHFIRPYPIKSLVIDIDNQYGRLTT